MIIAEINSQKFILETLKDAETLLDIINRAQPIETNYCSDYRAYYYPDHLCSVSIEISQRELVSLDEHKRRASEREARRQTEEQQAA